jgi:hypothetical protein
MSNKERIQQLEDETVDLAVAHDILAARVERLEALAPTPEPTTVSRCEACGLYITVGTHRDCAPTPEPVASPWQPMETCPEGVPVWALHENGKIHRWYTTERASDAAERRIAWCSATDHPEPPPHPDVLGKVEPSVVRPQWITDRKPTVDDLPIVSAGGKRIETPAEFEHWKEWSPRSLTMGWYHLPFPAPLPAPPTEPAPEPSPERCSTCLWLRSHGHDGNCPEAPEPSPEPETVERYTVTEDPIWRTLWIVKDNGGDMAECATQSDADKIAAALNSTPDPLLVGLVDACRAWRGHMDNDGWRNEGSEIGAYNRARIALFRAVDAYLAEQEGDQ